VAHPIFDNNDYSEDKQLAQEIIDLPEGWTPAQIDLSPVNNLLRRSRTNSIANASPVGIYQTMIMANVVLDYIGEQKAMVEKYLDLIEGTYKWEFAKESLQQNKKSVAAGDRAARVEDHVLEARNEKSSAKGYAELLDKKYRSVEKVYYGFKARYEKIEREAKKAGDGEL